MKQEIEGTGNSFGVWCMKLMNPDCFLGAEFVYLLQEMVQVNNNLKLLKNLIFLKFLMRIRTNNHYYRKVPYFSDSHLVIGS